MLEWLRLRLWALLQCWHEHVLVNLPVDFPRPLRLPLLLNDVSRDAPTPNANDDGSLAKE